MQITENNYTLIQGWMRTELELSGNELLVYAVIYGFSQDESSKFAGSRQYLADWCGCSIRTVQTILNDLTDRGYLVKSEKDLGGIKCCEYVAVRPEQHTGEKIAPAREKISLNNTSNNKTNNNNKILSNDNINYYGNTESEFESKMYTPAKKKRTTRGKSLYQKCVDYINEYTDIIDIQNVLLEYLKFRINVKDMPIHNINQWKSMLKKLDSSVEECNKPYVEVIKYNLDRAWLNFYPIPNKKNKKDTFAEGSGLSCEQTDTTEEERKEILEKQGKRVEF